MAYICFTILCMNTLETVGLFAVVLTLLVYIGFWLYDKRNMSKVVEKNGDPASLSIQLTAYERLVILTDRISLANLISRVPSGELTAQQYRKILTDTIKQEFDYNVSQQLYVAQHIWEAVTNLKEQNMYIIHQVAQSLPPNAMGSELGKQILELLQQDPNVTLNPIVLDALRYEAKKLMN